MKEKIPENESKLNQEAKKALKNLGEYPEPEYLYSLQLALWGLESGKFQADDRLRNSLEAMLGWKQAKVNDLLEKCLNGEPKEPVVWERVNGEVDLAEELLLSFDDVLKDLLPGYPKAPPPG
jgi:hypothetical protein